MRCSPSVLVPAAARRAPPIPCVTRPAATRAGRRRSPRAATLARPVPRASRRPRRSPRGRAVAAPREAAPPLRLLTPNAAHHAVPRRPQRVPQKLARNGSCSPLAALHASRVSRSRVPRGDGGWELTGFGPEQVGGWELGRWIWMLGWLGVEWIIHLWCRIALPCIYIYKNHDLI